MRLDLHCHTEYSYEECAAATVAEMAAAACAAGVEVLAVTDHCELNCWEEHRLAQTLPAGVAAIEAVKPAAGLKLLTGVELGQPCQERERAAEVLSGYPFDFVIGSLHSLRGRPDFYFFDYAALSDDELFSRFKQYYAELLEMAEWGGFDALAHITYPYRYLNAARAVRESLLRSEMFDCDADAVLETLAQGGKALELNTSSITRTEEDCALNLRYFKRFHELGGRFVTVGSDAHAPDRVGAGWEQACALLRGAGFTEAVYYENRRPVAAPLF